MHINKVFSNQTAHGGEEESLESWVTSTCTQVCGNSSIQQILLKNGISHGFSQFKP